MILKCLRCVLLIGLVLVVTCITTPPCMKSPEPDRVCANINNPVQGCNDKLYKNVCYGKKDGVQHFKPLSDDEKKPES